MKLVKLAVAGACLILSQSVLAGGGGPASWSNHFSNNPKAWYDERSEDDYFSTSVTPGWATNESCNDSGSFSVASYNIFHNVPFVSDFGDEMEQSLGEVTKCADVVLYQEAWDYDDIISDGPKSDMAARGFSMKTPSGYYCDDSSGAIENDCSGLVAFYKSNGGVTLVKEFTLDPFNNMTSFDVHKEKGVWGMIFRKENKYYYVFNTHFNYGNAGHLEGNSGDDSSRVSNMQESLAYITNAVNANRSAYPPAAVLFGGDFNADFERSANSRGRQLLNSAGAAAAFTDPYEMTGTFGAFETAGFHSNWVGGSVDQGPNGKAGGATADYDSVLLGDSTYFGTCSLSNIHYSGWAPRWYSNSGSRIWAYFTHSDHYGRWAKVQANC